MEAENRALRRMMGGEVDEQALREEEEAVRRWNRIEVEAMEMPPGVRRVVENKRAVKMKQREKSQASRNKMKEQILKDNYDR